LGFFNKLLIEGVYVEDQQKDTLLYAGALKVNITDWFFTKDIAELKYIGLENAVINMSRTDSVWNYHFIAAYFKSDGTAQPKDSTKKSQVFLLSALDLKNVRWVQADGWRGETLSAQIGNMQLRTSNGLDFGKDTLDIAMLRFDGLDFGIKNSDPNPLRIPPNNVSPFPLHSPEGLVVKMGELRIENSRFTNVGNNNRIPESGYFDGSHIDFTDLNLNLQSLTWQRDTLAGQMNLRAKERSGFEVKSLKANWRWHPEAMEFNDLALETNKSQLNGYYAMRYHNFDEMGNYEHDIRMVARIKNTKVHSDDIAFFAPSLKKWNKVFEIDGLFDGTEDNFKARQLTLKVGNNTYLKGDLAMNGLPDIEKTFIDFKGEEFTTTYQDALLFVPSLAKTTAVDLAALGKVKLKGSFTGFIRDFVVYGDLQTNLGRIEADANLKLPENGEPKYSGKMATNGFQLGRFLKNDQLGNVAFNGKVDGTGFKFGTMRTTLDGYLKSASYGGYTYKDLTIKGLLNQKQFNGLIATKDPNFDFTSDVSVNFDAPKPIIKLMGKARRIDFRALGLTKDHIVFQGKFNTNLSDIDIEKLIGEVGVDDASLSVNGTSIPLRKMRVKREQIGDKYRLSVSSDELDATLEGQYNLAGFTQQIQFFLNKYYPSFIPAPKKLLPNQNFSFNIETRDISNYLKLFTNKIEGGNNSFFSGTVSSSKGTIELNGTLPYMKFGRYDFSDAFFNAKGNLDSLALQIDANSIHIGDSLQLPKANLQLTAQNNISKIKVSTSANKTFNDAFLQAEVEAFNDGARVLFDKSSIVINDKIWTIDKGGEIIWRRSFVNADKFRASSGQESITANS
jgi:hypothetical protein